MNTSTQPLLRRTRWRRRAMAVATTLVLAASLAACTASTSADPAPANTAPATTASYPVTISICGQQVTFDAAPTRAVTNDINTFEDMVALGLEPHMVGDFGLDGYGPGGKSAVPTEYAAAFAKVRQISPDYVTLEPLVGAEADFLFAGWNYGLSVGTTLTPENLAKYGIKTLVLAESCAHVDKGEKSVSIEYTYSDLTNLGAIFGGQERAAALVDAMKSEIAAIQAKVAGLPPKKVFLYDSGTSAPLTAPGLAMPDALIELAGGVNIFHDLKQTWTSVSWEQVVAADPDCIIVNDYGSPDYQQKVDYLKSSPVTKNLTAVRQNCFVNLAYGQLTPGPLNAQAVAAIAHALYPTRVS